MPLTVSIDYDDITDFVEVLETTPELTAKESMIAMRKAVAEIERQTIVRTPSNTGALRGAWSKRVTRGQSMVKGEVFNPKEYAIVMEKSRRPGKRPPPTDVILYWVIRKGIKMSFKRGDKMVQATPEQMAFVIARSIGRKGIKAHKMLEEGFEAAEPTVMRAFNQVPEKVIDKLAK